MIKSWMTSQIPDTIYLWVRIEILVMLFLCSALDIATVECSIHKLELLVCRTFQHQNRPIQRLALWPAACTEFEKAGAQVGLTPSDVIQASDITYSCVANPQSAKEAISGKGGRYLEAQMQGSKVEAEEGTLVILAAGDKSLFDDCQSCFIAMSKNSFYLDMIMGTFNPELALEHLQKDMKLSIMLGDQVEQPLPLTAAANEVFKHAKRLGYGKHDASAIYIRARF
ncbi:hypothetical protein V9T40_006099 [Parthenolecanium corni]|uniref:3-hydroxyisobutyrate dehydrogenase-like NAD-binding domain-containing protein n=1 Tax=Parthenolecanium corni TaxID=536013 RepID=A0AAN9U493_9HEMI